MPIPDKVFSESSHNITHRTMKKGNNCEEQQRIERSHRCQMSRFHPHVVQRPVRLWLSQFHLKLLVLCGTFSHHQEGGQLSRMDAIAGFPAHQKSLIGEASARGEAGFCYCSLHTPPLSLFFLSSCFASLYGLCMVSLHTALTSFILHTIFIANTS